jgi:hypothetical protein
MNLFVDHFYDRGDTHDFCEDYAFSGKNTSGTIAFAIVSDGCSSSDHVDVGARILIHATHGYFKEIFENETCLSSCDKIKIGTGLIRHLSSYLSPEKKHLDFLSLPFQSLDATLIFAVSDGKRSFVFIYGDGGVITKNNCGEVGYRSVTYLSGAPYYLSNVFSHINKELYRKFYGVGNVYYEIDGQTCKSISAEDGIANGEIYTNGFFEFGPDITSITVSTDGIGSYQRRNGDGVIVGVPVTEMAVDFSDYKNANGSFVKRRMQMIAVNCRKNGTTHYDDVSAATIIIKD